MSVWVEKDFEERMQPHIDEAYRGLFTGLREISRSSRESDTDESVLFMDKNLAIDTVLTFNDGTVITLQEKSRRNFYYDRYGEIFTFEYYNDPRVKEEGEWFKLAAQLYFYGFVNAGENGYYKFWLLDVAKLRLCLTRRVGIAQLEREYLRYNKAPAKANFFAIPFEIIGGECIMYVGGEVTGKAALGAEGKYAQKAALKTV